jgi:hypothetical protein
MGEMENIFVMKDCDQAVIRLRGETVVKLLALASLIMLRLTKHLGRW